VPPTFGGGNKNRFVVRKGATDASAEIGTIYNCDVTWPALGWGPVRSTATATAATTVPALSGADFVAAMQVSWLNVTTDASYPGFVGAERGISRATETAVSVILKAAAVGLTQQANDQLSTCDATSTAAGAMLLVIQTLVAIIATYASRREMLHVVTKRNYISLPYCSARSYVQY
jgi:hypothetical protein